MFWCWYLSQVFDDNTIESKKLHTQKSQENFSIVELVLNLDLLLAYVQLCFISLSGNWYVFLGTKD